MDALGGLLFGLFTTAYMQFMERKSFVLCYRGLFGGERSLYEHADMSVKDLRAVYFCGVPS